MVKGRPLALWEVVYIVVKPLVDAEYTGYRANTVP